MYIFKLDKHILIYKTVAVDMKAASVTVPKSASVLCQDMPIPVEMDELTVEMDELTVEMDELTVEMDELTVEMDELTVEMDELTVEMDEVTGLLARLLWKSGKQWTGLIF
ncbi:hypothetical protein BsWGS_13434 [Bradybaena similaris]